MTSAGNSAMFWGGPMMKRLRKTRCACHLLAPALLWLGVALPAGDAVAQDTPSQIAQLPARNDGKAESHIWRTITLGANKDVKYLP
jgi:hypothetical protein